MCRQHIEIGTVGSKIFKIYKSCKNIVYGTFTVKIKRIITDNTSNMQCNVYLQYTVKVKHT